MEVKLDKELYEKLSPVLETKIIQLKRCDFLDISKKDLWNYLKNTKWINYNSIYINQLVNDILLIDGSNLNIR